MIFYIAIGLLILFEVFYVTSQNKVKLATLIEPVKPSTETKDESLQEQELDNFYLIDAKKQTKELEVWSQKAHKGMGSTVWELVDVKANIYSENMMYTVTGDTGVVDEIKKDMTISGHVKMVSSNGYLFHTDELRYNPEQKNIVTDDKVTMEGTKASQQEGLFLEGVGLVVHLTNHQMILQNEVRGEKPMSGGRMMKISSQQAELSGTAKTMIFRNNVVMKEGLMTVKGVYAEFQYRDGKLDTLFMDGGIHMQDPDKSGSAGIAIVYFNEDKYVFKKKPFVTQGENELIGEEIIIFNGGKRVQVKKANVEYHQEQEDKK